MYRDVTFEEEKLLEGQPSASVNNQCLLHVGSTVSSHEEYFTQRLLNNTGHYIPDKFWRIRSNPELFGNLNSGLTVC